METFGALLIVGGFICCFTVVGIPVGVFLIFLGMVFSAGGSGKTKIKVSSSASASSAASASGNVVHIINNVPDGYYGRPVQNRRTEYLDNQDERRESIGADVRRIIVGMVEGEDRHFGKIRVRVAKGGWLIQRGYKSEYYPLAWDASKYITSLIIEHSEKV